MVKDKKTLKTIKQYSKIKQYKEDLILHHPSPAPSIVAKWKMQIVAVRMPVFFNDVNSTAEKDYENCRNVHTKNV